MSEKTADQIRIIISALIIATLCVIFGYSAGRDLNQQNKKWNQENRGLK